MRVRQSRRPDPSPLRQAKGEKPPLKTGSKLRAALRVILI